MPQDAWRSDGLIDILGSHRRAAAAKAHDTGSEHLPHGRFPLAFPSLLLLWSKNKLAGDGINFGWRLGIVLAGFYIYGDCPGGGGENVLQGNVLHSMTIYDNNCMTGPLDVSHPGNSMYPGYQSLNVTKLASCEWYQVRVRVKVEVKVRVRLGVGLAKFLR